MVSQLELSTDDHVAYETKMVDSVIPCLVQLAVTAVDDNKRKVINHEVLLRTRDERPYVRKLALRTVSAFYDRLGEEFLSLLPETVPFIGEAMEDDEPEVEKEAQNLSAVIQRYLGEDISNYLKA